MIGTTEIIIIALLVVLLFGASAIPKIAKSLGQAKGEFEKGIEQGTQGNLENLSKLKPDRAEEAVPKKRTAKKKRNS